MSSFIAPEGKSYFAFSRFLGEKPGTIANNIYSKIPDTKGEPFDIFYVYDQGFGGLVLPLDCKNYFWASEESLPDKELLESIAENTFLMMDVKILRSAGAMISQRISWERTAAELMNELHNNEKFNYLLNARHIFIVFDVDAGVLITTQGEKTKAVLMLTHGHGEGAVRDLRQGQMIGTFSIMASILAQTIAATIVRIDGLESYDDIFVKTTQVMSGQEKKVGIAEKAVQLRLILEIGEQAVLSGFALDDSQSDMILALHFSERKWPAFAIPIENGRVPDNWIITNSVVNKDLYDVAFEYVQKGSEVIAGLPQMSMGALTTIDRWEIESYQNIRNLILGYANGDAIRPLSIAVFGSPGSGKSFGVTEIAKNILPGKIEKLEFNVSQFISPADLSAAFQKVRDVILEGKLPLVFFDEFDSDKDGIALGWIKSFLMPMQDGRFRDGMGEHPLGKCILVFAGGTAATFEEFANPADATEFKNIKGPDFLSRLRGTISILGPNPKGSQDKNYILRRALLLCSLIGRKMQGIQVSPVIIRAMLLVPSYHHGARSMEAILDMSRPEMGRLEPAALPFNTQLSLHLDADAFIRLVSEKI